MGFKRWIRPKPYPCVECVKTSSFPTMMTKPNTICHWCRLKLDKRRNRERLKTRSGGAPRTDI